MDSIVSFETMYNFEFQIENSETQNSKSKSKQLFIEDMMKKKHIEDFTTYINQERDFIRKKTNINFGEKCPNCDKMTVMQESVQLRSKDEPADVFDKCQNPSCSYSKKHT